MDTSGSQRKRQFVDGEDFTHPSKTAKVGKVDSNENPKISISNRYETLAGETTVAGPRRVSGNFILVQDSRIKKMQPIVVRFPRVDTSQW